jgi:hypothetical protein
MPRELPTADELLTFLFPKLNKFPQGFSFIENMGYVPLVLFI